MTETGSLERIRAIVAPIVADLKLDLYDLEFRGGTLRITIDTPPGSERGVNLEEIALATRLVGRDFDHHDPIPSHYTLEVTSPGLERTLRTPTHFQREVGKTVNVRLRDSHPSRSPASTWTLVSTNRQVRRGSASWGSCETFAAKPFSWQLSTRITVASDRYATFMAVRHSSFSSPTSMSSAA